MTRWKMVPVEPTDEMFMAGRRVSGDLDTWDAYLAAAPKWEPSEEDMTRAMTAWITSYRRRESADASLRAAIKAAVGGHDE